MEAAGRSVLLGDFGAWGTGTNIYPYPLAAAAQEVEMATTATEVQHGNMGAVRIWKWTLTDGETGDAIIVPEKADVSIQAYGTWSGGPTLTIQGSLIPDSTIDQFFGAKDGSNTLISLTGDGGAFVLENFYRMRPKITGGSSSSINIYMLLK